MEEITKPVPNYSADSFLQLPTDLHGKKTKTPSNERQRNIFKNQNQASTSVLSTVPWKRTDSYSCGVIGLHEEINDFYETMRPTEEEKEIRLKVIEHITRVIHSMWPHAKVEVFGSFRTGLYLPSSDIDMVVSGQWRSLPLSTLSKALQERGIFENDIIIIDNAKVPIVKLVHSPSKVKVDISFNMQNGVESAKMVKNLMKQYPTLPKLVLVLKQYLLQRGLNEVYNGGMSSYCLTLLIVSLLQGYHKPKTIPSNNLGTLLMEFFEHFGLNFNYEKVSIHFQNGGNYQPKYRSTGTILNIEDPFQKGNNIAKGTFQMHLLKMSFENAFHVLHKAVTESIFSNQPLNSYLSFIINVGEDILNERRWMSQNYSSILRKLSFLMETPHLESQEHLAAASSSNRKPAGKKKKLR